MKLILFLRAFIFSLLFPIVTAVLSLTGALAWQFTGSRRILDRCANYWARFVIWFLNIKTEIYGLENIPPLGQKPGSLFLFSHTSFLDIFLIVKNVYSVRFGSKAEFFSIPVFSWALRAGGVLQITRDNREKSIRVLEEAEERAKQGERFALSPEGGRSPEERLLPFKSGPFIFAIRSQIPIIPVVIKGAHSAWKKGSPFPCTHTWSTVIRVHYLPRVEVSPYNLENRRDLVKKVRDQMLVLTD